MSQVAMARITIDKRFCGPPASGNGGYVCGRLAEHIEGCARVRLSVPPPLDTPLSVYATEDGVELRDGERPVARAWPSGFNLAVPRAPSLDEARAMESRFNGFSHHAFPGCFVCGPERDEHDGLRIFPGLSEAGDAVGCVWKPDASLAGADGHIAPVFVWAALDCPSGWAFLHAGDCAAVLGEFCARIDADISAGEDLIVIGWELQHSGRKHHTASALFRPDGRAVACATALWFEIDPARLGAAD